MKVEFKAEMTIQWLQQNLKFVNNEWNIVVKKYNQNKPHPEEVEN